LLKTRATSRRSAPDLSSPRGTTLAEWMRRMSRSGAPADSGREWTQALISPDLLGRWATRTHGDTTFRLTQLLTGHGCFNRFLYRIGRAPSPGYSHCGALGSYSEKEDIYMYFVFVFHFIDNQLFNDTLAVHYTVVVYIHITITYYFTVNC